MQPNSNAMNYAADTHGAEHATKAQEHAFLQNIRCLERRSYIERYFLLSSAPILAGVKPSMLISFKHCCKSVWEELREQLEEAAGLCSIELCQGENIFSLLIYSKELMQLRLSAPSSRLILEQYGYPECEDLENLLAFLAGRFRQCSFPHEIGVFLGYPPKDVQGFIEKNGKDFLCCRYWKVYHDEGCARETFRDIDEAKARAICLLRQKIPIQTAAKMLAETKTSGNKIYTKRKGEIL